MLTLMNELKSVPMPSFNPAAAAAAGAGAGTVPFVMARDDAPASAAASAAAQPYNPAFALPLMTADPSAARPRGASPAAAAAAAAAGAGAGEGAPKTSHEFLAMKSLELQSIARSLCTLQIVDPTIGPDAILMPDMACAYNKIIPLINLNHAPKALAALREVTLRYPEKDRLTVAGTMADHAAFVDNHFIRGLLAAKCQYLATNYRHRFQLETLLQPPYEELAALPQHLFCWHGSSPDMSGVHFTPNSTFFIVAGVATQIRFVLNGGQRVDEALAAGEISAVVLAPDTAVESIKFLQPGGWLQVAYYQRDRRENAVASYDTIASRAKSLYEQSRGYDGFFATPPARAEFLALPRRATEIINSAVRDQNIRATPGYDESAPIKPYAVGLEKAQDVFVNYYIHRAEYSKKARLIKDEQAEAIAEFIDKNKLKEEMIVFLPRVTGDLTPTWASLGRAGQSTKKDLLNTKQLFRRVDALIEQSKELFAGPLGGAAGDGWVAQSQLGAVLKIFDNFDSSRVVPPFLASTANRPLLLHANDGKDGYVNTDEIYPPAVTARWRAQNPRWTLPNDGGLAVDLIRNPLRAFVGVPSLWLHTGEFDDRRRMNRRLRRMLIAAYAALFVDAAIEIINTPTTNAVGAPPDKVAWENKGFFDTSALALQKAQRFASGVHKWPLIGRIRVEDVYKIAYDAKSVEVKKEPTDIKPEMDKHKSIIHYLHQLKPSDDPARMAFGKEDPRKPFLVEWVQKERLIEQAVFDSVLDVVARIRWMVYYNSRTPQPPPRPPMQKQAAAAAAAAGAPAAAAAAPTEGKRGIGSITDAESGSPSKRQRPLFLASGGDGDFDDDEKVIQQQQPPQQDLKVQAPPPPRVDVTDAELRILHVMPSYQGMDRAAIAAKVASDQLIFTQQLARLKTFNIVAAAAAASPHPIAAATSPLTGGGRGMMVAYCTEYSTVAIARLVRSPVHTFRVHRVKTLTHPASHMATGPKRKERDTSETSHSQGAAAAAVAAAGVHTVSDTDDDDNNKEDLVDVKSAPAAAAAGAAHPNLDEFVDEPHWQMFVQIGAECMEIPDPRKAPTAEKKAAWDADGLNDPRPYMANAPAPGSFDKNDSEFQSAMAGFLLGVSNAILQESSLSPVVLAYQNHESKLWVLKLIDGTMDPHPVVDTLFDVKIDGPLTSRKAVRLFGPEYDSMIRLNNARYDLKSLPVSSPLTTAVTFDPTTGAVRDVRPFLLPGMRTEDMTDAQIAEGVADEYVRAVSAAAGLSEDEVSRLYIGISVRSRESELTDLIALYRGHATQVAGDVWCTPVVAPDRDLENTDWKQIFVQAVKDDAAQKRAASAAKNVIDGSIARGDQWKRMRTESEASAPAAAAAAAAGAGAQASTR
jgi:hypothetical protein